jgi:hypothetical protein
MSEYEICIDGYNKILDNLKDLSSTKNLFDFFESCKVDNFESPEKTRIKAMDETIECTRIVRKREKYYTNTYDPQFIHELIKEQPNKDEILNIFDLTKRENCANCISYVLYLNEIDYIKRNIDNMRFSVVNANKYLPNYVLRYYFDGSIFRTLARGIKIMSEDVKDYMNIIETLSFIINNEQVEIFMYFCNDNSNLSLIRNYRFMPMFENDINICVSREVDGLLSAVDCHNLNLFINNDKILLLYDIVDCYYMLNRYREHYSLWLNVYTYYIWNVLYEKNEETIVDILAGCFAIKLKVSEKYKNEIYKETKNNCQLLKFIYDIKNKNIIPTNIDVDLLKLTEYGFIIYSNKLNIEKIILKLHSNELSKEHTEIIKNNLSKEYLNLVYNNSGQILKILKDIQIDSKDNYNRPFIATKNIFDTGFDEIFLLNLFRPIINVANNNEHEIKIKSKLFDLVINENLQRNDNYTGTFEKQKKELGIILKNFNSKIYDIILNINNFKSSININSLEMEFLIEICGIADNYKEYIRYNLVNINGKYQNDSGSIKDVYVKNYKEIMDIIMSQIADIKSHEPQTSTFYRKKYIKYIKKNNLLKIK